jgi:hypothetical protein
MGPKGWKLAGPAWAGNIPSGTLVLRLTETQRGLLSHGLQKKADFRLTQCVNKLTSLVHAVSILSFK